MCYTQTTNQNTYMQRFNVVRKHLFTKDGEERVSWKQVGSVVIFPAKEGKKAGGILELNMFGESFPLFLQEPKSDSYQQQSAPAQPAHSDNIRIEDIPF